MQYRKIVFDIDGTLVDNEQAILRSLQKVLLVRTGREYSADQLSFCLGIPGDETLKRLGVEDASGTLQDWIELLGEYDDMVFLHEGIRELVKELSERGYGLGMVSSRTREMFEQDSKLDQIRQYFGTVICADDTQEHKPAGAPLLKYLEVTGEDKNRVLYVGDSVHDSGCAQNAGVDFALALWGSHTETSRAKYYLKKPKDLLSVL